jgi:hypothetical protein
MKRAFAFAALVALAPLGCHATPGWRVGWEIAQPPVMMTPTTLTPVATQPQAVYAVEETAAPMHIRRQFLGAARLDDCAPTAAAAGAEPLPVMPRKMPPAPPAAPNLTP